MSPVADAQPAPPKAFVAVAAGPNLLPPGDDDSRVALSAYAPTLICQSTTRLRTTTTSLGGDGRRPRREPSRGGGHARADGTTCFTPLPEYLVSHKSPKSSPKPQGRALCYHTSPPKGLGGQLAVPPPSGAVPVISCVWRRGGLTHVLLSRRWRLGKRGSEVVLRIAGLFLETVISLSRRYL